MCFGSICCSSLERPGAFEMCYLNYDIELTAQYKIFLYKGIKRSYNNGLGNGGTSGLLLPLTAAIQSLGFYIASKLSIGSSA